MGIAAAGSGVGTEVGGRDAGAGAIGGFGVVVVVAVEEGRERRGRGRKVVAWSRMGRRRSAERRARDVDGELSDMVELLMF